MGLSRPIQADSTIRRLLYSARSVARYGVGSFCFTAVSPLVIKPKMLVAFHARRRWHPIFPVRYLAGSGQRPTLSPSKSVATSF